MTQRIQFIWDFFGPDAKRTAEHQLEHLRAFVVRERPLLEETGAEVLADGHAIAWLVVDEGEVSALKAILRPNRGLPF
jgi:hypothetical protein